MAIRYACDGCGEMLRQGEEPKKLGIVVTREYCESCAPHAQNFLEAVSEAHTKVASAFRADLARIRAGFFEKLHRLPDTN